MNTAVSLAVSVGADVKTLQRALGHASAAVTLDMYADLFDKDLDELALTLDHHARNAGAARIPPDRAARDEGQRPGELSLRSCRLAANVATRAERPRNTWSARTYMQRSARWSGNVVQPQDLRKYRNLVDLVTIVANSTPMASWSSTKKNPV
jgi:hypothetical protein